MTDKTIPLLTAATEIDGNTLFIIDSGTQTFKCEADVIALFMRESLLPAGMISDFAGAEANVPSGWLICGGQDVSRTTYARLFLAIGTTYGTGDGSSTFTLPDCRGRVRAGKDNMGGTAANRITNAVAGFIGTVLGAFGGDQTTTPAGNIGGSQSIAHTHNIFHHHTMAHTHNMAHVHIWAAQTGATFPDWYCKSSQDPSRTSFSSSTDDKILNSAASTANTGSSLVVSTAQRIAGGAAQLYTTGVLGSASGSGTSANTDAASTSTTSSPSDYGDSGGMSTAATVNGSNFTFTGTASRNHEPVHPRNRHRDFQVTAEHVRRFFPVEQSNGGSRRDDRF